MLTDAQVKRLESALAAVAKVTDKLDGVRIGAQDAANVVGRVAQEVSAALVARLNPPSPPYVSPRMEAVRQQQRTGRTGKVTAVMVSRRTEPGPAPVGQRIVEGLAELEALGAKTPPRELVAFMAGYSNVTSKGFANAVGSLRTDGLISYPTTGTIALTDDGRRKAEPPAAPMTPEDVQSRVIARLGGASARILEPLLSAYPKSVARDEVAARAGYGNVTSKGFANAIGRLRSLGFIDYPTPGAIVAMPVLFLEGR